MDTSADAISAGNNILNRFVTARHRDRSFNSDKDVNESSDSGFFEAVADGSHLSNLASASKRGLLDRSNLANTSVSTLFGSPTDKTELFYTARKPIKNSNAVNTPGFTEAQTLDLIRVAISKLTTLRGEDVLFRSPSKDVDDGQSEAVEEILVCLQGVEEHLEGVGAVGLDLLAKQRNMQENMGMFSPVDKENSFPSSPGEFLSSGIATPVSKKLAHAGDSAEPPFAKTPEGDVLKVYMSNQLELNQAELREYEKIVASLEERLEDTASALEKSEARTKELEAQHEENSRHLQEQVKQLVAELDRKGEDVAAATDRARSYQQQMDSLRNLADDLTSRLQASEGALTESEDRLRDVLSKRPNPSLLAAMVTATNVSTDDSLSRDIPASPVRAALDNALEATEVEHAQFEELANKLLAQVQERDATVKELRRELQSAEERFLEELNEARADCDVVRGEMENLGRSTDEKIAELEEKATEQVDKLNAAQTDVKSLQALVTQLKGSLAGAEEMNQEFREMAEENDDEMALMQRQVQEAAIRASNAEEEAKTLKKHLAKAQNQASEDAVRYENLESLLNETKVQLKTIAGDTDTHVSVLNERIEQLQSDREGLRIKNANSENSIAELREELDAAQRASARQQEALEEAREEAQREMEQREMLWRELQEVIRSAPSSLQFPSPSKSDVNYSQESDDEQISEGQNDSYHLNVPADVPISEMNMSGDEDDTVSKASESVATMGATEVSRADYQALSQRLADAEQRAAEASEKGAGQMASSLRTAAMLDAENTRLRALGEHFKAAHASLVVEHKTAREQAIKVRGLERQLRTALQQAKIQEEAHEAALSKQQMINEEAFRRFEQEREQLHELRDAAQASLEEQQKVAASATEDALKAKSAREAAEEHATASERRVEELQGELDTRQEEAAQRAEEFASISSTLEKARRDLQQQEQALQVYKQENENVHLDWHSRHADLQEDFASLEGELAEAREQLTAQRTLSEELEAQMQSHRQQLQSCQSELQIMRAQAKEASQAKNEAIANLEIADEELAKRFKSIQRLSDAADEWQNKCEEAELVAERERVKAQAAEAAASVSADKVFEVEEELSRRTDELRTASEEVRSMEARLNVIQGELERVQTEDIAALENMKKEQQAVVDQIQAQLQQECKAKENAMEEKQHSEEALRTARAAEQSQTALTASTQQRADQLQHDLREAREALAKMSKADVDAGLEIHNLVSQIRTGIEKADLGVILETNDEISEVVRAALEQHNAEVEADVSIQETEMSSHSIVLDSQSLPSVGEHIAVLQSEVTESLRSLTSTTAAASALQLQNESLTISTESMNSQLQALQALRDSQAKRIGELENLSNTANERVEMLRAEAARNATAMAASSRRAEATLRELHVVLQETATHVLHTVGSSLSSASVDTALAATAAAAVASTKQGDESETGVHSSQWEAVLLEVERATSSLAASLEEAAGTLTGREQTLAAQRKELEQQQHALNESSAAARSAIDANSSFIQDPNVTDISRLAYEHAQLRVLVAELGRGKEALEAEGRTTIGINSELKTALAEAERLCESLKARNRALQTENDALTAVKEQSNGSGSSQADDAVALQQAESELLRIRADNDVLLQLQQSLEAELERTRATENTTKGSHTERDSVADVKTMDCERLLGAMYSTLDQLVATGLSGGDKADAPAKAQSARLHELQVVALSQAGVHSMSDRLDAAVQYFSELRVWAREEQRCKHSLIARVEAAGREVSASRAAETDASKMTQQLRQHRDRDEADTRALRRELSEARRALAVAEEEKRRATAESSKLRRDVADERAHVSRLSVEEQARAAEATRLRNETEQQRQRSAKTAAQLTASKEALEAAQGKISRLQKENSELLSQISSESTIPSTMVSAAPSSPGEAGGAAALGALKDRVEELKAALMNAKDELRSQRDTRSRAEAAMASQELEIRTLKRKVELAEGRCDSLTNEKYILHDEKSRVQASLAEVQQQLSVELNKRHRVEAAVQNPQKAQSALPAAVDANSAQIEQLRVRLEESDNLRKAADDERSNLRAQLAQLRAEQDMQHASNLQSTTAQHAYEVEASKLKAKAERLQRELSSNKDEAAASRAETRRLRRLVLDASSQVREATNVMRAEAAQTGAVLSSPEPRPSSPGRNENDEHSDTLGLSELRSSLAALREGLAWLRHGPQQRSALLEEKRKVESKLRALETEYEDFRLRGEQEISQARAEVKTQQARAETARAALRQARSSESEMRGQMQDSAADAADRASRAEAEVGRLQARIEQLEQSAPQHQFASGAQAQGPALHSALQELRAVEHHRGVLRGMIERLESQLKLTVDSATQAFEGVAEGLSKDQENTVRQAAKYRARAAAYEQVIHLYRTGVMALFPDGSSYSAAQYEALLAAHNSSDANQKAEGWFETEIAAVRHSYEAELRLADSECVELRGKLRQVDAFSSELTRRYEELVQAQYGSHSADSDGKNAERANQFIERTMSAQSVEITQLRKSLSDEKDLCRRRHRQIVDTLNKTMREKDLALAKLRHEGEGDFIPPPSSAHFQEISPFKFSPAHYGAAPMPYAGGFNASFTASSPAPAWADAGNYMASPAPTKSAALPAQATAPRASKQQTANTGSYKLQTNDGAGSAALRVRRSK